MLWAVKALLLASVLLIIFIPIGKFGRGFDLLVFAFSMLLVYFYWRLSYWVSEKNVKQTRTSDSPILLSAFVAKVPFLNTEDLERGRMIITEDNIEFYQLPKKKKKNGPSCELTWSLEKEKIQSFGFGKVAGARKGFIIYAEEEPVSFVSLRLFKHKEELFKAMGWEVPLSEAKPQEPKDS